MLSKARGGLVFFAIFLIAVSSAFAGTTKVRMQTPIRPRLPLRGNERILIAPFIVANDLDKKQDRRLEKLDLQGEFRKFLVKQLRKTKLQIVEAPASAVLPTQNLAELARAKEFWRTVGVSSGVDLIVSGVIEFRIEDRSGYRTESYRSPVNGQDLQRQIYVENTGYTFDIVILAFNGQTGEKIYQDELKDFRQTSTGRADELKGLFENLSELETQLKNLFVVQSREAIRFLLN